jgi:hypothetical protein
MRAHSLRRSLWIANVLLGAGVVAIAAWFVLDVRKATADPAFRSPAFAAKARTDYDKRPKPGRIETSPVTLAMLKEIDRPDYERLKYWIFAGGLPPDPTPETAVVEQPKPKGLDTIGKILFLLYLGPKEQGEPSGSVVTWQFNSGKRLWFAPGEFVREKPEEPKRFKIVDIVRTAERIFKLIYDVYDDPTKEPVERLELIHDLTQKQGGGIRPLPPTPPAGTTAASDASEGTGKPSVAGEDARGVVAGTTSGGDPTAAERSEGPPRFEDLKPTITEEDAGARVRVEFDQKTYDYVRGKSVNDLAETVKTQPYVDRSTGKAMGLKITGFSGDSPAQRFDIKQGDILVAIDGQPVHSRGDVVNIIQRMSPDTSRVAVTIDRNGRQIVYQIDPRDPHTRRAAGHAAGRLGTR